MTARKISLRVLLATVLSIYVSICAYSVLIPLILVYTWKEMLEFWTKMFLVVNLIGPLATVFVYVVYKPVATVLRLQERNEQPSPEAVHRAQGAFKSIEGFLFFIGATAYLAGAIFNFGLDILRGNPIDRIHAIYRLILAISFGVINGIVTARMVNLAWIDAKNNMCITELEKDKKIITTNIKLGLPILLLLTVVIIYAASAVLYYSHRCNLNPILLTPSIIIPHFLKTFGILLLISIGLLISLLIENQAHINHLKNQIALVSQGSMDLTKRVNIVSFDDIGNMTAGFNRILDSLQSSFSTLKQSETSVLETGEQTKHIISSSKNEAEQISALIA
ncbi:MAG: hypothetical protein SNJ56_05505, partial [Termitinemataceae bacterium]